MSGIRRFGAAAAALVAVVTLAAGLGGVASADVISITALEAADHIGETAQVCGRVASAAHIGAVKGQPTFLNLVEPYPNQPFGVVIWGSTRSQFDGRPERMFDGKEICVTGKIERYRGKPQIIVDDPGQIVLVDPPLGGSEYTDTERILMKALLSSLGHEANYGTGEWDEEAVAAMVAFQEDAGLTPSGEPGPETLRALADAVQGMEDADRDLVIRLLLFEMARREE